MKKPQVTIWTAVETQLKLDVPNEEQKLPLKKHAGRFKRQIAGALKKETEFELKRAEFAYVGKTQIDKVVLARLFK